MKQGVLCAFVLVTDRHMNECMVFGFEPSGTDAPRP